MTDPPSPEVRNLAMRLFAAARDERPGPALGRRLALIAPSTQPPGAVLDRAPRACEARARGSSWRAFWLAAAGLFAAGGGLWLAFDESVATVSISPDRVRAQTKPAESAMREPTLPESALAARPDVSAETAERGSVEPFRSRKSAPPATVAHPRRPAKVPSPTTAPAASQEAKPMTLTGEIDLLKEARSSLRSGQAGRALQLLERHARERAGSSLEAEATLLRIEALSALGRTRDASDLATRFVRANPDSALGDRARSFIRSAEPAAP